MPWTPARLADLDEASFRTNILVPLLKAMGYRDVEHYHGPNELGKDITAWNPTDDGARENVAVVAKAGDVNARATGDAATIATQIRQALGSDYTDPVTGQTQRLDRVLVTTTGTIREQARQAILTQLDDWDRRAVRFWPGAKVVELLERYLPAGTVGEDLADLRDRLGSIEGFNVEATTTPSGTMVKVTPATADGPVIRAALEFPATEEGRRLAREVRRFFEEGGGVTIPRVAIDAFEVHSALRSLVGHQAPAWLRIEQAPSGPIPIRLDVLGAGRASVGGIDLRVWRKGSRQATFLTDKRDAVWLELVLRTDESITLRLHAQPAGHPVHRAREVVALWRAVAGGAAFELRHAETNQRFLRVDEAPTMEPPPDALVELLDALAEIQDRFNVAFHLPTHLDDALLDDARHLRDAIRTGVFEEPFDTFSFTAPDETAANVLHLFSGTEPQQVTLAYGDGRYEILGHQLPIGPMTRYLGPLVLTDMNREILEQSVAAGRDEHPVVLAATEDQPVVNYLLDFLGDAERALYEEAFRGLPPHDGSNGAEDEQASG